MLELMRKPRLAPPHLLHLLLLAGCGARSSLYAPEPEPASPACGNLLVEPGEACDDGNATATDACLPGCALARCGDGAVQAGVEACDDGNQVAEDGCTNGCALPSCGNGLVEAGEACDDGNPIDTDDCPSRCLPAICGDGFVHAGFEECDGGPANADRPAYLLVQGALSRPVAPVGRLASVDAFYDYGSASSHTGFEGLRASRLFLYRDLGPGGQLGLVTIHGIDQEATGQEQPKSRARQDFLGLPEGTFLAVSDDNDVEFTMPEPGLARGDWNFNGNTDGGALSGLPSTGAFVIDVVPGFVSGIDAWGYVDEAGEIVALDLQTTARIIGLGTPSACRLDCTVPRCGDAILDGGEACDDGNTAGGDGCAADCKSPD